MCLRVLQPLPFRYCFVPLEPWAWLFSAKYHLLADASSGSCDDFGLLGRPLGEEVEFWRAVPGATVLWASSEL